MVEKKPDPSQSKTDAAKSKPDAAKSKTDAAKSKTDAAKSKTDAAKSKTDSSKQALKKDKKAASKSKEQKPSSKPAGKETPKQTKLSKKETTKQKLSLAYGKLKYRAFLSHGKWRLVNKAEALKASRKELAKGVIKKPKRRPNVIHKPIKGEKNGGTRAIHLKRKNYYPSEKKPRVHKARGLYSKHKRHFRSSLTPGAILILLAGVNKGKRVILVKCLDSGLLLVTGPFRLNGVPLRRVQPCHVIGTKTKLDLSNFVLPEAVNDKLFKRVVEKRKVKKGDKTIFVPKKKAYKPTAQRKELQVEVDKQILDIIKQHPDKKLLSVYLATMFGLRNNQYPHRMQF